MKRLLRSLQICLVICIVCLATFVPSALAGNYSLCVSVMGAKNDLADPFNDFACVEFYRPAGECPNDAESKAVDAAKAVSADLGWSSTWTDGNAWKRGWLNGAYYDPASKNKGCRPRGFGEDEIVARKAIGGIEYLVYD